MRADHRYVGHHFVKIQTGPRAFRQVEKRFFNKQNLVLLCKPAQKLLRTLPNETPSKMTKNYNAKMIGAFDLARISRNKLVSNRHRCRTSRFIRLLELKQPSPSISIPICAVLSVGSVRNR